jgi:hypothetical protein
MPLVYNELHRIAQRYMSDEAAGHTLQATALVNEAYLRLIQGSSDVERRRLGPDNPDTALSAYNLGCAAAHQGHRDEALSLLAQAVDHGLAPFGDLAIESDTDLTSLHGDPRFAALVAHAKEKAAATQKPK